MNDRYTTFVCQFSFFHRHSATRGFHMSHAELYKTEPDPQSGFTSLSVRAMQEEEEEEVMEGGRTDGWGEWWQLLKEEMLRLPGTRLVLQLQTQTRTHTLPDFTQINASISACTSSFASSLRSECWWSCRPPVFTLSQSSFLSKVTSLSLKRHYVRAQLL